MSPHGPSSIFTYVVFQARALPPNTPQCDPEASQSIFTNPIIAPKTTIATLDLTHQVLASRTVQTRILHGLDDPSTPPTVLREILHALLLFFANTYNTVFGLSSGPPLHDPLAVAVILSNLNPAFAKAHPGQALKFYDSEGERFCVDIITDGLHGKDLAATGQLGRSFAAATEAHGVAVPRGVDVNAFWDMILDCIQRADDWNAARK